MHSRPGERTKGGHREILRSRVFAMMVRSLVHTTRTHTSPWSPVEKREMKVAIVVRVV